MEEQIRRPSSILPLEPTNAAGFPRCGKRCWVFPRVGLDDNFFEAGGTSLLATVLLTRINRAFGRELPIAAIFESPTVRAMAECLGETQQGARPAAEEASPDRPAKRSSQTRTQKMELSLSSP